MKKKALKFMSILIMMVFITSTCMCNSIKADSLVSSGNTTSDGCFKYDVYNDNSGSYAVITEYVGSDAATVTDITLPATVGNGIRIKSITMNFGNSVFHNCTNLEKVILSDGIEEIGEYTFMNCDRLSSIIIPNSVTYIGDYAFISCNRLSSIVIPNSVTSIGYLAFSCCFSLNSIVIPSSVTSIGSVAFNHCDSLSSITIGNSSVFIGHHVFDSCSSLSSVTTYVKNGAQDNVTSYLSSNYGKSVTSIPLVSTTVSASAAMLSPYVRNNDDITLQMKDTGGNAINFNGEHEVIISGVKKAADGSYGNVSFIQNNITTNSALTLDSASTTGQAISMDFNNGKTKFDIALNAAESQDLIFNIDGAIKTQALTVTPQIVKVTSVGTLSNINISNGTALFSLGLPGNVNVNLSDMTTTSAAVTWDVGSPAYDGNKPGTYIFTGTLTLPKEVVNPDNKTASVKVTVYSSGGNSGDRDKSNEGSGSTPGVTTPVPIKASVERLSAGSKVDTAIEIAKAVFSGKVNNVIIASEDTYPDALAGSMLAYKAKAPILMIGKSDSDRQKIIDYIKSNMDSSGTVYILGGIGAVDSDTEADLRTSGFGKIERIGGKDRFETAAKVADVAEVKEGTPVFIVSGENYPDAITISNIAAIKQYPVLMANEDEIPESTITEILNIKPGKVYVMGGERVISTKIQEKIAKLTGLDNGNIERIGGTDRFETSLKAAQYFNLSGDKICIATGNDFTDALEGSIYAANNNAVMLLCGDTITDSMKSYLSAKKSSQVIVIGNEIEISKDIEIQISNLLNK